MIGMFPFLPTCAVVILVIAAIIINVVGHWMSWPLERS